MELQFTRSTPRIAEITFDQNDSALVRARVTQAAGYLSAGSGKLKSPVTPEAEQETAEPANGFIGEPADSNEPGTEDSTPEPPTVVKFVIAQDVDSLEVRDFLEHIAEAAAAEEASDSIPPVIVSKYL